MEKPRSCYRHEVKEKKVTQQHQVKQLMQNHISEQKHDESSANKEVIRLAVIAITLNIRLISSDMPDHMQEHALRYARSLAGDQHPRKSSHNPSQFAQALKKEFDSVYGPAWHCVMGKSFGSFVTHTPGGFLYFSIDSVSVLLFKTEVQLVREA